MVATQLRPSRAPAAHDASTWVQVKSESSGAAVAPASLAPVGDIPKLEESIICSIDAIALESAVVLSGINTLRDVRTAVKSCDIDPFVPSQDKALLHMAQALSDATDEREHLTVIENLAGRLRDGRTQLQCLVREEKAIGRERARIVFAERLRRAWCEVCRSALAALVATNGDMRSSLSHAYHQNYAVLGSLLSGAINGLTPCIDENGALYAPQLPQQRRWPRHSVLQTCTVDYGGVSISAFVKDASAGGLGLEKMPLLARKAPLRVTMESGRTFDCVVAWSKGGRTGVRFHAPLKPSDPLLRG